MHISQEYLDKLQKLFEKRTIVLVCVITMCCLVFGMFYNIFVNLRTGDLRLEMNYPGSEKGLYPDGSVFDISELVSDNILDNAKASLECKDISNDDLRNQIEITTQFSSSYLEQVFSIVQSDTNAVYMPTTFFIHYTQKNKFAKNEARKLMINIADEYTKYFNERYSSKNDILKFSQDDYDFSSKDYPEIYTTFSNKLDSMLALLAEHEKERGNFVGKDGANIKTIYNELKDFRDVNLEKFNSFIVQAGVSKNNEKYIKSINYLIEDNKDKFKKTNNKSLIEKAALEKYDPNIIAIAFIPSIDASNDYYMNRTKTGIDDLTEQSYSDGINAAATLKEIERLNTLKEKFNLPNGSDEENILKAESMVNSISSELESLSKRVVAVDNDFLQYKTKNYFNLIIAKKKSIISKRLILKSLIAGIFLALVFVIFFDPLILMLKKKARSVKTVMNVIRNDNTKRK